MGPNPQAASWYSLCLQENTISHWNPNFFKESKSTTWVKRRDNDSWKLGRPVGGKHATTEFGVGVGGVGGEGGLRVEEGEGGGQGGRLGDRAGDDEAR